MDLVQEQELWLQGVAQRDYFFDIVFACRHRGQLEKIRANLLRVDLRQGRLADPGRAPEYEREKVFLFHGHGQRPTLADQVFLANELLQVFGADAGGKGWLGHVPILHPPQQGWNEAAEGNILAAYG